MCPTCWDFSSWTEFQFHQMLFLQQLIWSYDFPSFAYWYSRLHRLISNAESALHAWNKSHLVMIHNCFYTLLVHTLLKSRNLDVMRNTSLSLSHSFSHYHGKYSYKYFYHYPTSQSSFSLVLVQQPPHWFPCIIFSLFQPFSTQ